MPRLACVHLHVHWVGTWACMNVPVRTCHFVKIGVDCSLMNMPLSEARRAQT